MLFRETARSSFLRGLDHQDTLKNKDEDRWRRITIQSRVSKGTSSNFGHYFNVQEKDKRYGLYLDMYDWHFEGAGYQ